MSVTDNAPFMSRSDLKLGAKELAKLRNNQAARKYRERKKNEKKSYENTLLERLTDLEGERNSLRIENAGLKAENQLLGN